MGNSSYKQPTNEIVEAINKQSEYFHQAFTTENFNLQQKIQELKKENVSLQQALQTKKITETLINARMLDENNNEKTKSAISVQKIENFVDKMLENPDINIQYFPDVVERQIYINVFRLVLGMIEEFSDLTKFELIGHNIKLKIEE